MPIYERYVVWNLIEGGKSVAGLGPIYADTDIQARDGAVRWADKQMFDGYEVVVSQVIDARS
jgi:hypothetical protein